MPLPIFCCFLHELKLICVLFKVECLMSGTFHVLDRCWENKWVKCPRSQMVPSDTSTTAFIETKTLGFKLSFFLLYLYLQKDSHLLYIPDLWHHKITNFKWKLTIQFALTLETHIYTQSNKVKNLQIVQNEYFLKAPHDSCFY